MPETVYDSVSKEEYFVATYKELLDFCNEVRELGGGELITQLLPGYSGDSTKCLIAKNLNFNCRVTPLFPDHNIKLHRQNDPWVMIVDDAQTAVNIATGLNLELVCHFDRGNSNGTYSLAIKLPTYIGNSAHAFDNDLAFREFAVA